MVEMTVEDGALVVRLRGLDRLWALRRQVRVPLDRVRGVTADPGVTRESAGVRVGGAHVPRLIRAGTFRSGGETVFWDVHDPRGAVVVELSGQRWARLVVEVADPARTVAGVNAALPA